MAHQLTDAQRDAIGYVGGGILAVCLIPQVAKVLITRSARDISIAWSVMYSVGLVLSLVYLVLKDALAAWIPITVEIAGCLLVLFLKLWYEHTAAGRRYSAAKQQQLQELTLPVFDSTTAARKDSDDHDAVQEPQQGLARVSGTLVAFGQAAAAAVSSSGDISWRGRAVLGDAQEAPAGLTVPMIDVSAHGGSRHGGSWHGGSRHGGSKHGGSRHGGSWHGGSRYGGAEDAAQAACQHKQGQQQPWLGVHQEAGALKSGAAAAAAAAAAQQAASAEALEVKCTGTSLGSCSASSSNTSLAQQEAGGGRGQQVGAAAAVAQQQQQSGRPLEPLFASTWQLQPVAPVAVSPAAVPAAAVPAAAPGSPSRGPGNAAIASTGSFSFR